ncbi:hypothetical protein [Spirilliplanes yamanashiensis]|uniref:Uncharacterized protein n=1 Tax=Spirilliplanes yamanashiensis TaxID=42233 RepID=A0A8J4DJA7_9ACTN|nr:hypothetical protein [Spirilliplanes yamanashiensis]MDP9817305.1 hypothetical protein [Spirilliplanes yamanashiensis]GIJ03043.1 hypothetical protein Sya03_23950 [Spirilliplanes yamanashiensis]
MTDHIPATPAPADPARHAAPRGGLLRPALWLLLIVSAAVNALVSILELPLAVGIASGLVTLGCIGALVAHHYRSRKD